MCPPSKQNKLITRFFGKEGDFSAAGRCRNSGAATEREAASVSRVDFFDSGFRGASLFVRHRNQPPAGVLVVGFFLPAAEKIDLLETGPGQDLFPVIQQTNAEADGEGLEVASVLGVDEITDPDGHHVRVVVHDEEAGVVPGVQEGIDSGLVMNHGIRHSLVENEHAAGFQDTVHALQGVKSVGVVQDFEESAGEADDRIETGRKMVVEVAEIDLVQGHGEAGGGEGLPGPVEHSGGEVAAFDIEPEIGEQFQVSAGAAGAVEKPGGSVRLARIAFSALCKFA